MNNKKLLNINNLLIDIKINLQNIIDIYEKRLKFEIDISNDEITINETKMMNRLIGNFYDKLDYILSKINDIEEKNNILNMYYLDLKDISKKYLKIQNDYMSRLKAIRCKDYFADIVKEFNLNDSDIFFNNNEVYISLKGFKLLSKEKIDIIEKIKNEIKNTDGEILFLSVSIQELSSIYNDFFTKYITKISYKN